MCDVTLPHAQQRMTGPDLGSSTTALTAAGGTGGIYFTRERPAGLRNIEQTDHRRSPRGSYIQHHVLTVLLLPLPLLIVLVVAVFFVAAWSGGGFGCVSVGRFTRTDHRRSPRES